MKMKVFSSIRSSLHVLGSVVSSDRVPKEIGVCLELVQTCHRDLQDLIELRNNHLKLLEASPPQILKRLNSVIETAECGLVEARAIVEKCRPKAHRDNKTPLHNQLEWLWSASSQFECQQPLLSRNHAAVLAELTFLRQLTTWALLDDHQRTQDGDSHNINRLLSDSSLEGKASIVLSTSSTWTAPTSTSNLSKTTTKMIEYSDLPEPVFPGFLAESVASTDSGPPTPLVRASRSSTWSPTGRESAPSRGNVVNSSHNQTLSLLFDD